MNDLIEPIAQSPHLAFRMLALPLVAFFLFRSVVRLVRGDRHRWVSMLASAIWLSAAIAIFDPSLTNKVANWLGIGRGADLVVYVVAICFIASFFYFYHKCRRLESDLTRVVRRLAINDAERELGANRAELGNGT